MKKNVLILILSFFSIALTAQVSPIQVHKSEISKDRKKESKLMFSAEDDNGGVVIIRQYSAGLIGKVPKGYLIEYYDSGLNLLNEREIEIDDSSIKNMFLKDGKIHLIEYRRNRDTDSNDYNVLTASLTSLEFTSSNLFSINRKDVKKPFYIGIGLIPITNHGKIDHDPTGEVILSENREFITFNFDLKDDDNERHLVMVYNSDFEKIFEREFTQEIKDRLFEYNSITTSNEDGSVYFLGKSYVDSKATKRDGEANYTYKLYKISKEGIKNTTFSTNENFVASLQILMKNGRLACVGFYSEKNDHRYKGTTYFNLDPKTLAINASSFNPFTEQFMVDKYGEKRGKRKKKKGKELRDLVYRGMFMDNDGNVLFNAEEYFIVTQTSYGMYGAMNTQTIYNFNDIITCKISPKGKMLWARNINKDQERANYIDYLSFTATEHNGDMLIFLNGPEKIRIKNDDRIIIKDTGRKGMCLYVVEIKPNGDFSYEKVVDDDESKMTYKVADGIVSKDSGKVFIEGNRGRKKRILKLSF